MISREETIRRLEQAAEEIAALKKALAQEWPESSSSPAGTRAFLDKCGGWEDDRPPEAIVAEIYAARRATDRDAPNLDE